MLFLKKIFRRLFGRGQRPAVTIDTVARTLDGFCIIGWQKNNEIVSIDVLDENDKPLTLQRTLVARPDVEAAIGQPASGFQLLITTSLSIDQLTLCATTKQNRQQRIKLDLRGEMAELSGESAPIQSTSDSELHGACELALVTDNHVLVVGWVLDSAKVASFTLLSGKHGELASGTDVIRYARRDVAEQFGRSEMAGRAGFLAVLARTNSLEIKKSQVRLWLQTASTPTSFAIAELERADEHPMLNLKRALNHWSPHHPEQLPFAAALLPIIQAIYPRIDAPDVVRLDFNNPSSTPRASIIIPLYGRIDFMRYQLSYFSRHGGYKDCEVLYILDDPSMTEAARSLAKDMAIITSQPFSLLLLSRNLGFGAANNLAVEHATSDKLVLLNSDVMPRSHDWLDKMLATLSLPNAGIVGARLLFEDGTLQHDGMSPMALSEYPGVVFNDHPCKGWPEALSPHPATTNPCALVTAACWAVNKQDYKALGGFDPAFVLGDFEDSDMCLRMLDIGKTNYICRDAVLYHLERQSQNLVESGRWKHNLTILNAYQYTARWHQRLLSLYPQESTT